MSKFTGRVPPLADPRLTLEMRMPDGAGSKSPPFDVTVTLALALFEGSALLVAISEQESGEAGAVYVTTFSVPLMLPHEASQVTLLSIVPVTTAVNSCVSFTTSPTAAGAITTATGPVGAVTVTSALALTPDRSALVAVTVHEPGSSGAVYPILDSGPNHQWSGLGPMDPHVAVQVTPPLRQCDVALNRTRPPTTTSTSLGVTRMLGPDKQHPLTSDATTNEPTHINTACGFLRASTSDLLGRVPRARCRHRSVLGSASDRAVSRHRAGCTDHAHHQQRSAK